jgi:hypothetical protein
MDPDRDKNPANDRLARILNWIGLTIGVALLWFVLKIDIL